MLCPVSSFSSDPSVFRVPVEPTPENGLRLPSEFMVEKLQAANRTRISEVIGRLDDLTLRKLARSLTIALGLTEV